MLARRTHGSSSDDAHPTQSVNEIWYRRATRIPCRSAIRGVDWHDLRAWVDIVRCPHRTAARTPHCTPSTKRRNAARRPASQTTPDRVPSSDLSVKGRHKRPKAPRAVMLRKIMSHTHASPISMPEVMLRGLLLVTDIPAPGAGTRVPATIRGQTGTQEGGSVKARDASPRDQSNPGQSRNALGFPICFLHVRVCRSFAPCAAPMVQPRLLDLESVWLVTKPTRKIMVRHTHLFRWGCWSASQGVDVSNKERPVVLEKRIVPSMAGTLRGRMPVDLSPGCVAARRWPVCGPCFSADSSRGVGGLVETLGCAGPPPQRASWSAFNLASGEATRRTTQCCGTRAGQRADVERRRSSSSSSTRCMHRRLDLGRADGTPVRRRLVDWSVQPPVDLVASVQHQIRIGSAGYIMYKWYFYSFATSGWPNMTEMRTQRAPTPCPDIYHGWAATLGAVLLILRRPVTSHRTPLVHLKPSFLHVLTD
ncbi:hypothetical protein ACCO45_005554 [Purpureocillium lilacinum]|uniref:Uncharacterized protein n=1 Tax=Purpureocillium lilacinum TaxID=33203 RepID=A0ACC4DWY2_PURLI